MAGMFPVYLVTLQIMVDLTTQMFTTEYIYLPKDSVQLDSKTVLTLVKKRVPWNVALEFCRTTFEGQAGTLVKVDSYDVMKLILDSAPGNSLMDAWIGLHWRTCDSGHCLAWSDMNCSDQQPWDYQHFGPDQDKYDSSSNCYYADNDTGEWWRDSCNESHQFICQHLESPEGSSYNYAEISANFYTITTTAANQETCTSACSNITGCFLTWPSTQQCLVGVAEPGGGAYVKTPMYTIEKKDESTNLKTNNNADDSEPVACVPVSATSLNTNTGSSHTLDTLCSHVVSTVTSTVTSTMTDVSTVFTASTVVSTSMVEPPCTRQVISCTDNIITTTTTTSSCNDASPTAFMVTSTIITATTTTETVVHNGCLNTAPVSGQFMTSTVYITPVVTYTETESCSVNQSYSTLNLTDEEVAERTSSIINALSVESSHLSSTRRKKESAPDSRVSATVSGVAAVLFLCCVGICIVSLDMPSFVAQFKAVLAELRGSGEVGVSGAGVSGAGVSGAGVSGAGVSGAEVSGAGVAGVRKVGAVGLRNVEGLGARRVGGLGIRTVRVGGVQSAEGVGGGDADGVAVRGAEGLEVAENATERAVGDNG